MTPRRGTSDLRRLLLVLALCWLVSVIVLIARTPGPGAATPETLAVQVGEALRTGNTSMLQPLVAVGGEEAARAEVERFASLRVDGTGIAGGAVVVDFTRPDGSRGTVRLPITETGGRYQVDLLIPTA